MGHVRAKVPTDNAMPGGVVLLVELLFNIGSDVLLDVELFKRLVGAVDCVLLHFLRHVSVLDHCGPACHYDYMASAC